MARVGAHLRKRMPVGLALATAALAALPSASAPSVPEVVQRDWYFRETLRAIDDWEAICQRLEGESDLPVFPVLESGQVVEWPNPIPATLLPRDDAKGRVCLRVQAGEIAVERVAPTGEVEDEEIKPGDVVVGYHHPGGGGHDQWYHGFERRFDRLCQFRPQPAPFGLRLQAPLDLRPGQNDLTLELAGAGPKRVDVGLRVELLTPDDTRELFRHQVSIGLAEKATVALSVPLDGPGGALLLLTLEADGMTYRVPLLTHVERIAPILDGVAKILRDAPDEPAEAQLRRLRRTHADLLPQMPPAAGPIHAWRDLFEQASALRDRLLLRRLAFDELLFIKRKPYFSEQPYMDAHHLYNRPGGAIHALSPVRPDGKLRTVAGSLGEGIYRDICLHWDARRLLFSFGNGSDKWRGDQSYHLYEVGLDGRGLRQLTFGPKNDCEPFYLPNGQIGFTSDRPEHYVMCGGDRHAALLHTMEADGSGIQQISFNLFNDFNPSVLPDGRIIYDRWEYNERSVTSLHSLFTIHPDGTHMAPFYGNTTIRPNVLMWPRAVPGSRKVMALFTAHHGQTHGPVGLIDPALGVDYAEPIEILTPGIPLMGEANEDTRVGWCADPQPLSEDTFLCSYTPTVLPWLEWTWGLYVGDRHGNLALVYRDWDISCAEPVPVVRRPTPRSLPPPPPGADAREVDTDATLLLVNVYRGLDGVPAGAASYLRVLEDVPRVSVPTGGVIKVSLTSIYTVKRIFGTVPIEADGSAHFVVPANRPVYFEVLDADQLEIQRMRSVVCLKPGETRTCIGCHEPRTTAPPSRAALAARRPPDRPQPPPWGLHTMSFLRDVQPILNDRCISCHAYDRTSNAVILTDDLTARFSVAYRELVPYLNVANAMRWDNPADVLPARPFSYGSHSSPLTRLLREGHHDVKLAPDEWLALINWVDANGVYYDDYRWTWHDRNIFTDQYAEPLGEVYGRRCATCHGEGDGAHGTWWLSLNRHDVRQSRMLIAPLARKAGGWGRCGESVFADDGDRDYQAVLTTLTGLRDALRQRPRQDLKSIIGTPAETQVVSLPRPPPPPPSPAIEPDEPGEWVWLSDLPWESGSAGWTPNNDGLPRRDADIEERRLRLGAVVCPKGIGTHASSEIVYRLDGAYDLFRATIAAAEARGTVVFQVYTDDLLAYESPVMHGLRGSRAVRVPVAGAHVLRLVVTDAGDGIICDEANWLSARLRRR
ncbi:MAG: NPCBM/NEW2 domain-containing protein [Armatimonadota bacterium]